MLHVQAAAWRLRVREHGDPSPPPGDVPAGPLASRPADRSGRLRPGINVYSLTAEDARGSTGLGVNSRVPRGVETPRACVV